MIKSYWKYLFVLLCLSPAKALAQDSLNNQVYVEVTSALTDNFTFGYYHILDEHFLGVDLGVIKDFGSNLLERHESTGYFFSLSAGKRLSPGRETYLFLRFVHANYDRTKFDESPEVTRKFNPVALMIGVSEEIWSGYAFFLKLESAVGFMPSARSDSELRLRAYHFEFFQIAGLTLNAKIKFGFKF